MKSLLKRFAVFLIQGTIGLVFVLFTLLMLVEWMAGCGETYIDAKGVRHNHECIFINQPKDRK